MSSQTTTTTTETVETYPSVVGDVKLATVSYDITGQPIDSSAEPVIDANAVFGVNTETFDQAPPLPIVEPVAESEYGF